MASPERGEGRNSATGIWKPCEYEETGGDKSVCASHDGVRCQTRSGLFGKGLQRLLGTQAQLEGEGRGADPDVHQQHFFPRCEAARKDEGQVDGYSAGSHPALAAEDPDALAPGEDNGRPKPGSSASSASIRVNNSAGWTGLTRYSSALASKPATLSVTWPAQSMMMGRWAVRGSAQPPGHLVPVHPRHHHVHQDQVGGFGHSFLESLRPVPSWENLISPGMEHEPDEFQALRVVFHNQDFCAHLRCMVSQNR